MRISAAKVSAPTSRIRSMQPLRSERKITPKIFPTKLLNFRHADKGNNVHSAQLCHPCSIQQARTLHQAAFSFARHPGHFPSHKPGRLRKETAGRYHRFHLYRSLE